MENQTRFNLNAAMENWRNELAAQPNFSTDDRRELETHLRDSIAELCRCGLNEEERFWLARRRIGQPQKLGEEFVKANPAKIWRERIFWMAIGFLVLEFWVPIINFLRGLFPYYFRGDVNSILFYQTIFYGPIIWIATSLALGRMNKIHVLGSLLFCRRVYFVLTATTVTVLLLGIDFLQLHIEASRMFQRFPDWRHQFVRQQFEWILLANGIGCCVLIALIAWLMPKRNQKIPERA